MFLVEGEIRSQFESLESTYKYIMAQKAELSSFLKDVNRVVVLGCGSSYSIAKSSALQLSQNTGISAWAIAAGDLIVNFDDYKKIVEGATLLLLSRSGSTSELIMAAELCRNHDPSIDVISVCAVKDAPVSTIADINLEIPWAFDHSICQTRTVTNLYVSTVLLSAITSGNEEIILEVEKLKKLSHSFTASVESTLEDMAKQDWCNVTVLADSGVSGLAEEGALAFKEICLMQSNFNHVLDIRHGSIAVIRDDSLVMAYLSQGNQQFQFELIKDVGARAGHMVVFSDSSIPLDNSYVTRIGLPEGLSDDVKAVFMLYCIQLLCLKKAILLNINPDKPEGLNAWVKLEG